MVLNGEGMKQKQTVYYYSTFQDDFVGKPGEKAELPEAYCYIRSGRIYNAWAAFFHKMMGKIAIFYFTFLKKVKVVNREVLKPYSDTGCFLYGNHTMPVGDVFSPALVGDGRRFYTIASAVNLKLPVIGKWLPALGALPVPTHAQQVKAFEAAIQKRIEENNLVVIYPEAHVWPYYTKIREYEATSFRYPVQCNAPAFAMTTTYQKRGKKKKPAVTIYVDGPFYPNVTLPKKEQRKVLRQQVYEAMKKRSKESTYAYISYQAKEEKR